MDKNNQQNQQPSPPETPESSITIEDDSDPQVDYMDVELTEYLSELPTTRSAPGPSYQPRFVDPSTYRSDANSDSFEATVLFTGNIVVNPSTSRSDANSDSFAATVLFTGFLEGSVSNITPSRSIFNLDDESSSSSSSSDEEPFDLDSIEFNSDIEGLDAHPSQAVTDLSTRENSDDEEVLPSPKRRKMDPADESDKKA